MRKNTITTKTNLTKAGMQKNSSSGSLNKKLTSNVTTKPTVSKKPNPKLNSKDT
jgi:hypothetical protein